MIVPLYILTAFIAGAYIGARLTVRHIRAEFRKIDEDSVTFWPERS